MIGQVSVAAATAVVGYNLCRDQLWAKSSLPRVIVGLGVAGSAAAGDTKIIAYVGVRRIGEFYNLNTGFPQRDQIIPMMEIIPPNEELTLIVDDAPSTNPINILIQFQP